MQYVKNFNTWTATNINALSHNFPLNIFYGFQSLRLYQNFCNFAGGMLQFPVALTSKPIEYLCGIKTSMPNRDSDFQAALNLCRYRNLRTDVI